MVADHHRDLHWQFALAVLNEDIISSLKRAGHKANLVLTVDHGTINTGILHAGLWITQNKNRRGDELTGIELLVAQYRQFGHIGVFPFPDDLFYRRLCSINPLDRNRSVFAASKFLHHSLEVRVDGQRQPLISPLQVDKQWDRRTLDLAKKHRRIVGVTSVGPHSIDNRSDFKNRIDLFIHDHQLFGIILNELLQIRPQIFGCGQHFVYLSFIAWSYLCYCCLPCHLEFLPSLLNKLPTYSLGPPERNQFLAVRG